MALLRCVYCALYQGDVCSDGTPVISGDGEHGDGLTEQVLLEPDALVAGYEQVMAFLDGGPERGAILEEVPSSVVGCVHPVVREEVSQQVRDAVVEKYSQEPPPCRRSSCSIFEAWARTVFTCSSVT